MSESKVKILVACHREYPMPKSQLYMPCFVGASLKDASLVPNGYVPDSDGDNISDLNPLFCELTAAYYGYKNLKCDYLGLVHYRRYFAGNELFQVNAKKVKILSESQLDKLLEKCDVILPKKRNYYIETLYSHYEHTMFVEPLDKTGEIIKRDYPEYYKEFELIKKRRSGHMFNMFVMKKSVLDGYLDWLFDILFKLKDEVNVDSYSAFHKRFFGRVSELLLDVYLRTNKIEYKEVKLVSTEKVNWFKKIISFLKAKFTGKKYEKSF